MRNSTNEYPMYVVTGISRLTGEREVISSPHSLPKATAIRDRMSARLHSHSAYRRLKVEPAVSEGSLFG